MNKCVGCSRSIWFFEKATKEEYWHSICWEMWEIGYDVAMKFAENENRIHGYDTASEMYKRRSWGCV